MGNCQSDNVIENTVKAKTMSNRVLMLQQNEKKLYPDMEEWEGERYSGVGIKRMKAYKCTLRVDELKAKRIQFWTDKGKLDLYWTTIMHAAYSDEEGIELTPVNGCMNHLSYGRQHYFIPNYCINDPYFERVYLEKGEEKTITVILYEGAKEKNVPVKVSNTITGFELKMLYLDHLKLSNLSYKVKLFYSGCEIQDDNNLYQFKIEDEYKIAVILSNIE